MEIIPIIPVYVARDDKIYDVRIWQFSPFQWLMLIAIFTPYASSISLPGKVMNSPQIPLFQASVSNYQYYSYEANLKIIYLPVHYSQQTIGNNGGVL